MSNMVGPSMRIGPPPTRKEAPFAVGVRVLPTPNWQGSRKPCGFSPGEN